MGLIKYFILRIPKTIHCVRNREQTMCHLVASVATAVSFTENEHQESFQATSLLIPLCLKIYPSRIKGFDEKGWKGFGGKIINGCDNLML